MGKSVTTEDTVEAVFQRVVELTESGKLAWVDRIETGAAPTPEWRYKAETNMGAVFFEPLDGKLRVVHGGGYAEVLLPKVRLMELASAICLNSA